jgi:ribonucleoside-diphosphate reductase alpha chain
MQAAIQKWVDTSISKTINVPEDIPFEAFQNVYLEAFRLGCKGCTTYRPNDVTGSVISVDPKPTETVLEVEANAHEWDPEAAQEFYGEKLIARPETLEGKTYKVKLNGDPAFYVTITDIVQAGNRRPFEVFINTKNPEHIAWSTALTMMISAIFRRPHDASFVVEELKSVFDPKGGGFWRGAYRPSVVAAIGQILEDHMSAIGYGSFGHEGGVTTTSGLQEDEVAAVLKPAGPSCPKCFSFNVKTESGCPTCLDCGHSKCG